MRNVFASVALAAALALPQVARAEEATEPVNSGALSLSGGMDWTTAYIFRGYEVVDTGLVVQPFAQISVAAYEGEHLSITPFVGIWNSVQSEKRAGNSNWYETDIYGGIDFACGNFTVSALYTLYTYPGDDAGDIQEIGVKLAYDDSSFAEEHGLPVALAPYIAWYRETSDANGPQDQYLEAGIAPSVDLEDTPVSLTFPVALAMSPDGYFLESDGSNDFLGFVSVGAYASMALDSIPDRFGEWSVYGGVTWYHFLADSVQLSNGEDREDEFVGKVGLTFAY